MSTQEPVPILVILVGKHMCFVVKTSIAGMLYSEFIQQYILSSLPLFLTLVLQRNKANLALYES